MADYKLKSLRGRHRRRFIKMMGMAGASMGVMGPRFLNYLVDIGGHSLADAATNSGQRALIVTCGNGVYAWFQELWPVPDVALAANMGGAFANTSSWLYVPEHGYVDPDQGELIHRPGNNPFYYGPDAPWFDHAAGTALRPMTAFIAGNDETHTEFPESAAIVSGNADLPATIGSIQAVQTSAIVPVLGIDPLKYGYAQGAPEVVTAPSPEGIVDLFNSAASRFVLAEEQDQQLFESYYKAFVGLKKQAARSSWQPQLEITKTAARLIGLNFESQLAPSSVAIANYGIAEMLTAGVDMTASQKSGLDAFGRTLIAVANAFKLNLTNSAVVGLSPGPTSEQTFTDPHKTNDGATERQQARNTTHFLGRILDAFYADLATAPDLEVPGKNLDETTVFVAYGDTPHTPLELDAWPDATPEDCNWIYCMGQDHLKEGWFGTVHPDGSVDGWDPATGDAVPGQPSSQTANAASAAVTYAVARGDMNTVAQYYVGPPIDGVINDV